MLEPCQDHKRLMDDDAGRTRGHGVYCPGLVWGRDMLLLDQIQSEILVPTPIQARGDRVLGSCTRGSC